MKTKTSLKKRLLISLPLLLIGSGFVIWLILKPEYDYHYYKLNDCENSYLTAIIYWEPGERGVILAKGKHESLPTNDFLIYRGLSGFDAYFRAVATCENGTVIVNSIEHFFYKQKGSENIKPRVTYSDTYKKLREEGNGIEIEFY
ncbi:hypothetical protein I2I11_15205 [Pontibacter sp. 172403-2]|uniref:hypothetical protein n=1 Tax=Pontibacter rufus TaxID=2791028 RepID=UPI0018B012E4|nr:hypothetical protein [Pontibacter sp. 172403-2]MBF9254651.1 hypothetical protein [Pontibacter sp. 172403-2]